MRGKFTVRIGFLDVGQGDTIVVSIPAKQEAVIVDCFDPEAVMQYLEHQAIKYLRGLIITHLHLDHYKGAVEFLNNCEQELGLTCERILFNWPRVLKGRLDQVLSDTDKHSDVSSDQKINTNQKRTAFNDLKSWIDRHDEQFGTLVRQFDTGRLQLDGAISEVVDLIHPRHSYMDDLLLLNDESGVLKIQGLNSSAILMGDIESVGWNSLKRKYGNVGSDVLKFPHHGAWKDSDPNLLLDAVDPSIIVISVGTTGVKYNHPNPQVLDALYERDSIHVLCTQATTQCSSSIAKSKKAVKNLLSRDSRFYIEQSGCPCAGTIIVELGETAYILQPNPEFHQESIIAPHFSSHKCRIH
jgi:beta-lactamase superfamily II metal-dependent hydrolase